MVSKYRTRSVCRALAAACLVALAWPGPSPVSGQESGGELQPGQPEYGNAPRIHLSFDDGRIDRILRSTTSTSMRDVIAYATSVRVEGDPDRPVALVLFAFKILDRSVVSRYRSEAFSVSAGSSVRLPSSALPPARWFDKVAGAATDGFVVAGRLISSDAAVRDPMPLILDGVFFLTDERKGRPMIYLAAIPALDGSSKDASTTAPALVIGRL
jgi:hypothetical protein